MIRIIASVYLLFPATLWCQDLGQLTNEEKTEISSHLKSSMENLESLVAGLTTEQWNYKQVDSVWSIAEISEHLEKSEKGLFSLVTDQLTSSPAENRVEEERIKTRVVMDAITSRDNKMKTRPELEPKGLYKTPDDFLKSFRNSDTKV